MHVISIAARKGGVGKTTITTHLSVLAAEDGGQVLLLDTDPQGSLAWWHGLRKDEFPRLIQCDAKEIPEILEQARGMGFKYVLVDTPPHAENSISAAMRHSDIVVVPTRPGPLDLAAVSTTLDMAGRLGKTPLAVINQSPPKTSQLSEPSIVVEAREALASMGATVAETAVANRVSMSHALLSGSTVCEYEPKGKATKEVKGLWSDIKKRLEH